MSEEKRVYIYQIKDALNLEQQCGDEDSLKRYATVPDFNRPGLELTGFFEKNELKRVIVLGQKERAYIATMSEDIQRVRFDLLTNHSVPCIIITSGMKVPPILEQIANSKNFPILSSELKTYRVCSELVGFLTEMTAVTDSFHGVMMNIYGKGVMITGESGIGKSEVALELIRKGHLIVADDRVDISRVHNRLICTAPDVLKHLLEVRGIGVIDVNLMFGGSAFLDRCDLDFIINLVSDEQFGDANRLDPTENSRSILDLDVPVIQIPVTLGKSLSVIVESAVTTFILRENGIDMNQSFKDRISEMIRNRGNQS